MGFKNTFCLKLLKFSKLKILRLLALLSIKTCLKKKNPSKKCFVRIIIIIKPQSI